MGAPASAPPQSLPLSIDQLSVSTLIALILQYTAHSLFCFLRASVLPLLPHLPFYDYLAFVYSSFLRSHTPNSTSQSHALENFYGPQSQAYDRTRRRLLLGREELLGCLAAQMRARWKSGDLGGRKPIWVDIGGGTGWNIETMGKLVDVPSFFERVYLVDLSESLCRVARGRFKRLGWMNVRVVCEDALRFRIPLRDPRYLDLHRAAGEHAMKADLVTMSYSLSMMPSPYPLVDRIVEMLRPEGLVGVVDFYVQSAYELIGRTNTGGNLHRPVGWLARSFWRAWFDLDRVNLEGGRRDYVAHRLGTIMEINGRNKGMGWIPYYIWIGCQKGNLSGISSENPTNPEYRSEIEYQDASMVKASLSSASPSLDPSCSLTQATGCGSVDGAPSVFFQSTSCPRLDYSDTPGPGSPFNSSSEYIYSFTWEDQVVDRKLLDIGTSDTILALTSAGDGILHYLLDNPAQIHAVDLNPAQNHLLELKVAAIQTVEYEDFWRMFGEGRHDDFSSLLLHRLSPVMSSRAVQWWNDRGARIFGSPRGLYDTGGSKWVGRIVRWLFGFLSLSGEVYRLCIAPTLDIQRQYWKELRPIIVNRLMIHAVISHSLFLWRALGVPANQTKLIEADYAEDPPSSSSSLHSSFLPWSMTTAAALSRYLTETLDPVFNETHLRFSNYFYLLPLLGYYTPECHPPYLSPASFAPLRAALHTVNPQKSRLKIHTSTILSTLHTLSPYSLTIAVIMDSMDWFDGGSWSGKREARMQVDELERVLKIGGRVLLRSAGRQPWYLETFEKRGFEVKAIAVRGRGNCIDVPMDR